MFVRNLFQSLVDNLDSNQSIIITGARQVGKTTLLKQFLNYLLDHSYSAFYITLEDPDFLRTLNEHPKNLFLLFPIKEKQKNIFLIDEVQYLDNPTNFLKYLYDEYSDKIKLYVTGSSAFYLDSKFKDSLAGRKKLYFMNTLSLDEFLLFKGESDLAKSVRNLPYNHLDTKTLPIAFRRTLFRYINEYMTYGGYPRVVLSETNEEKEEILFELITSYIKKDVIESGIKNSQQVLDLLKILATQCGNLLNINSLSKLLRVSFTAVENYLFTLQKAFILSTIRPFTRNIRNEIKKMPKLYFNDIGLRNALLKDFRSLDLKQDRGQIFENFIFRMFLDRVAADEIKFWRNQQGNEVDFIVKEELACEVKFNLEAINLRKYRSFKKLYPQIPLHFIFHEGQDYPDDKTYWQI